MAGSLTYLNSHRHGAGKQAAAGAGRVHHVALPQRQLSGLFAVVGDRDRAAGAIAGTESLAAKIGMPLREFSKSKLPRRGGDGSAVASDRGGRSPGAAPPIAPRASGKTIRRCAGHQNSRSAAPDSVAAVVEIVFSARS